MNGAESDRPRERDWRATHALEGAVWRGLRGLTRGRRVFTLRSRRSATLQCSLLFVLLCASCDSQPSAPPSPPSDPTLRPPAAADPSLEGLRRFPVESGIVEYELTGFQNGTETLWFEKWGLRSARRTSAVVESPEGKQPIEKLEIIDGPWIWQLNLRTKVGARSRNPWIAELRAAGDRDFRELGELLMQKERAKPIGTDTIAGKPCNLWESHEGQKRTWMWESLPLKTEVNVVGHVTTTEAKSLREEVPIPAEVFLAPPEVKIEAAFETPSPAELIEKRKQGTKG